MSDVNQFSLFGLDLSELHKRVRLGVQQLIWGDEAGVKDWLCPKVDYYQLEDLQKTAVPEEGEDAHLIEVVLPESQVLAMSMTLPASAEIFLDEAVAAQVQSHSPFSVDETCWGSKVVARVNGSLTVEIVLVSRVTANEAMLSATEALDRVVPFGISAKGPSAHIPLLEYRNSAIRERYFNNLRLFGLRTLGGVCGIIFLVLFPAMWTTQTAQQYETLLEETEQRSRGVVRLRSSLVEAQEQFAEARQFFAAQPDYRPWLHGLAGVTADAIYLNRLSLKSTTLTVSGLAMNAADYQATLAESGLFSEVNAPAAFTLDNRSGRERFTLTMEILGGARD
jgi:general secretion pathway protein L